jgi:hypothetical protein
MSRGLFFAAAATLTVLSSLTAASAMPASIGASLQPADAAVTRVQFYPGYDYGSPLDLPAAVIGGTLGFVAGALSTTTNFGPYDPNFGPSWDERMAACAANYISFDPTTGTYTTYEGFQVFCPFLR